MQVQKRLREDMESKIMINCDNMGLGMVKFMQPNLALVCKLMDEHMPSDGSASKIPAAAGHVLVKGDNNGAEVEAKVIITS